MCADRKEVVNFSKKEGGRLLLEILKQKLNNLVVTGSSRSTTFLNIPPK